MTVSRNTQALQWDSGSDSKSVTAGATVESDVMTANGAAATWGILLKADNSGTPAAGDTVDIYIAVTTGDPDAEPETADEYSGDGGIVGATPLVQLDTNADDPAISYVSIPAAFKSAKFVVVSNAASNAIVVSGRVTELLA